MKITENPFFIMNISNRTTSEKIQEICSTNRLLMNDEKYSEYENALTNSNQRLEAELNWFPGISEKQFDSIKYEINSLEEYNIISQITICRVALEKENDIDKIYKIIKIFDKLLTNEIYNNIEYIYNIINNDRKIINFQPVNDKNKVEEYVEKIIDQVLSEIALKFEKFSEQNKINLLNKIVETNIGKIDNIYDYGKVEKKVYENYIVSLENKIQSIEKEIINLLERYNPRNLGLQERYDYAEKIKSKINYWYAYTKPIIIFTVQAKSDEEAFNYIGKIFELILEKVKVVNSMGDSYTFNSLRECLIEITKYIPTIEQSFKDVLKQEKIQKEKYEEDLKVHLERQKKQNMKESISNFIVGLVIFFVVVGLISAADESSTSSSSSSSSSYVTTSELSTQISNLKTTIENQESRLDSLETEITAKEIEMNNKYNQHVNTGYTSYYNQYLELYNEYVELKNSYDELYRNYSSNIDKYNEKVEEYNSR